jgi:hypothetical protein
VIRQGRQEQNSIPETMEVLKPNQTLQVEKELISKTLANMPVEGKMLAEFASRLPADPSNPQTPTADAGIYTTRITKVPRMTEYPGMRFHLLDGEQSIGYCEAEFSPENKAAYIAYVEIAENRRLQGFSGLLRRTVIEASRKYGFEEVHDKPTAAATMVWLMREGFRTYNHQGDQQAPIDRRIMEKIVEGQKLKDDEKRSKYDEALSVFSRASEHLKEATGEYGLIMVKKLV